MIHIEPLRDGVEIVRWFGDDSDPQECFDNHKPYRAIAILVWTGKSVEICGLHGEMTRKMRMAMHCKLVERGAVKATATRNGRNVEWTQ